jgi:hypothetical protein
VAALHIRDSGSRLQIRLQADVDVVHGDQVASIWSAVPERSRTAYSRDPTPGQPIAAALAHEPRHESLEALRRFAEYY